MESGKALEILQAARVNLEAAQEAVHDANERIRELVSTGRATEAEIGAAYSAFNRAVDWQSTCESTLNAAIRLTGS